MGEEVVGYGDEILATGMAKGLAAQGKLAAFGDGKKIVWTDQSREIFWGNPNVAPPGLERQANLVWIPHYRGHRLYASSLEGQWIWNLDFKPQRGELFLTPSEQRRAEPHGRGFVVVEPNVKKMAPNKQWPFERYSAVAGALGRQGYRVVQFAGARTLPGVPVIPTARFRDAAAVLANALLYVGPEGGLHHAAAALGVPAVVIFGGFIHPRTTGYGGHKNLYSGGPVACGTIGRVCPHCVEAMRAITTSDVLTATAEILHERGSEGLPLARRRGAPRHVPRVEP